MSQIEWVGREDWAGTEAIPVCLGRVPSIMSNIKISLNGEKSHKQGPFGLCGGHLPLAHLPERGQLWWLSKPLDTAEVPQGAALMEPPTHLRVGCSLGMWP